jgi:hypothetical protein
VKVYVLAILGMVASLASAAAQPRVRVEIDAKEPLLVGQQVRVNVTVLAPNFFLSSPQFPTFDLPGAIVTLLDENALNTTEQTFTARLAEGAQLTAAPALVAKVVVTQTLDGDPGAVKVGDALTPTLETSRPIRRP